MGTGGQGTGKDLAGPAREHARPQRPITPGLRETGNAVFSQDWPNVVAPGLGQVLRAGQGPGPKPVGVHGASDEEALDVIGAQSLERL